MSTCKLRCPMCVVVRSACSARLWAVESETLFGHSAKLLALKLFISGAAKPRQVRPSPTPFFSLKPRVKHRWMTHSTLGECPYPFLLLYDTNKATLQILVRVPSLQSRLKSVLILCVHPERTASAILGSMDTSSWSLSTPMDG